MMMPGSGLFGNQAAASQALAIYQQTLNRVPGLEESDTGNLALRSALLDEFRANKTRKWELRVSDVAVQCCQRF